MVALPAFLLFSIQPVFTKIVLPQLGGSTRLWFVARPWTDDFPNILKAAWLKFSENLQSRP